MGTLSSSENFNPVQRTRAIYNEKEILDRNKPCQEHHVWGQKESSRRRWCGEDDRRSTVEAVGNVDGVSGLEGGTEIEINEIVGFGVLRNRGVGWGSGLSRPCLAPMAWHWQGLVKFG